MGTIEKWYLGISESGIVSDVLPLKKMLGEQLFIIECRNYDELKMYRDTMLKVKEKFDAGKAFNLN